MKRIKLILACGLTLAVTGLTTLLVAAGASKDATATVRSVLGTVNYKGPEGGDFKPLKVNQVLAPGTILQSGPNSQAYLIVNGLTSTVKVTENTTMTLTTMITYPAGDSSTMLKLDGGTLLGSVKKLSANSDYKITVPNGVAAIRGTDWQVTVTLNRTTGTYTITFTSVTGTIVCQVTPPPGSVPVPGVIPGGGNVGGGGVGGPTTQTLNSGQSWTVTATVTTSTVEGQPPTVTTISVTAPIGVGRVGLADLVAQELGLSYVANTGNPPLQGGLAPSGWVPPATGPGGTPVPTPTVPTGTPGVPSPSGIAPPSLPGVPPPPPPPPPPLPPNPNPSTQG
jgi:hypothetical protein